MLAGLAIIAVLSPKCALPIIWAALAIPISDPFLAVLFCSVITNNVLVQPREPPQIFPCRGDHYVETAIFKNLEAQYQITRKCGAQAKIST